MSDRDQRAGHVISGYETLDQLAGGVVVKGSQTAGGHSGQRRPGGAVIDAGEYQPDPLVVTAPRLDRPDQPLRLAPDRSVHVLQHEWEQPMEPGEGQGRLALTAVDGQDGEAGGLRGGVPQQCGLAGAQVAAEQQRAARTRGRARVSNARTA